MTKGKKRRVFNCIIVYRIIWIELFGIVTIGSKYIEMLFYTGLIKSGNIINMEANNGRR